MSRNIAYANTILNKLKKDFKDEIPKKVNLLDQAKVIKENVLISVDAAIDLANLSQESNVLDLKTEKKALQREKEKIKEEVVTIAVFGYVSSGKSSFVNSLIEEDLLTVKEERATSIVTKLRHPENYPKRKGDIEIVYKTKNEILDEFDEYLNGFTDIAKIDLDELQDIVEKKDFFNLINNKNKYLQKVKAFNIEELSIEDKRNIRIHRDYIEKFLKSIYTNQSNLGEIRARSSEKVKELLVDENKSIFIKEVNYYKNNKLLKNLQLVDTPGIGSYNKLDTKMSEKFLIQSDIVLFVTDSSLSLEREQEVEFFDLIYDLSKEDKRILEKIFVVINKIDNTTKNKEKIKEDILERLEKDFMEFNDKHIFFVSALNEEYKRNEKLLVQYKNPKNYEPEELEKLKNTLYTFSTIESNVKFLESKINTINQIFDKVDDSFKTNIANLNKSIEKIESNIQEFHDKKVEIKSKLTEKLNKTIDAFFEKKYQEIYQCLEKKIERVKEKSYIQEKARTKKIFNGLKSNEFKGKAEEFLKQSVKCLTQEIAHNINKEIFSKSEIENLKSSINEEIKNSINELQNKYNIEFLIPEFEIEKINLDIESDFNVNRSTLREIFDFLNPFKWGKESKYMDTLGEEWSRYIENEYAHTLYKKIFTDNKALLILEEGKLPPLTLYTKGAKYYSEIVSQDLKQFPKTIKNDIQEALTDILETIDNKLEEQRREKNKSTDNRKTVLEHKQYIQDKFLEIQNQYIKKAEKQNERLSNTEIDQFKIGKDYFNAKEYRKAIEAIEESLKQEIDKNEVYFYLGKCYMYLKDYGEAKECFNKSNYLESKELIKEITILIKENVLLVKIYDNLTAEIIYQQEVYNDKNDGLFGKSLKTLIATVTEKIEDDLLNGDDSVIIYIKANDEVCKLFEKFFDGDNEIKRVLYGN